LSKPLNRADPAAREIAAPRMIRAAEVRPASYQQDDNSIELVWSTGAKGMRFDWFDGEYYMEELSMDPSAVRLDRLNSGAPLLDSHDDWTLSAVLGSVVPGTARLQDGEGIARVRLATTPDVVDVNQKIIDGHIRNVSVGYAVHEYQRTEKEGELPVLLATDWEPMELSMVAVPFDAGAQVRARSARQGGSNPCTIRGTAASPQTEEHMEENENQAGTNTAADENNAGATGAGDGGNTAGTGGTAVTATGATEGQGGANEAGDQGRSGVVNAKRIREVCQRTGLGSDVALALIERHEERPFDEAALNAEIVNRYAAARHVPPIDGAITIAVDEKDKYRAALTSALHVRIADSGIKPKDGGEVFGHMTTREIARDFLQRSGVKGHAAMSPYELVSAALGFQRFGAQTSSDFALALQQAGNLAIIDAYQQVDDTDWKQLSRQRSANDFRPNPMTGITGTPEFLVVQENGEYTYASFADIGSSYQLWTAGRIIALSRQLIINDQLGLFGDMAGHLGRGAALHEANSWWANILGNVVLASDGVALFHANHGNLAASGSALSVTSLGAARLAMRSQKDRDGVTPIRVTPKYLVFGPAIETTVDQLLTSIIANQSSNVVPEYVRSLTPVLQERITDNSWYLFADPQRVPVMQHAYLRGQEGIYTDTRVGFEVDGVEYKGRIDFNASAFDYKGAYKNPGA
jgi:hypothetical protein